MSISRQMRRKRKRQQKRPAQQQAVPPAQNVPLSLQVEEKRIVICSPMMDMCHTSFCSSMIHLVAYTLSQTAQMQAPLEMTFLQYGTSILPLSRQFLGVKALECQATHILWIDSDMEFPADMVLRFARHDHPIIAANCMARRPPYMLTARNEANEQVWTTKESSGLEKVSRIGFGVVWMSTEVLQKIPLPWFDLEWIPEMGIFRGEDFVFCEKAKAAGFDLYIDHDISKEVNHIGQFGYCPTLRAPPVARSDTQ